MLTSTKGLLPLIDVFVLTALLLFAEVTGGGGNGANLHPEPTTAIQTDIHLRGDGSLCFGNVTVPATQMDTRETGALFEKFLATMRSESETIGIEIDRETPFEAVRAALSLLEQSGVETTMLTPRGGGS